MSQDQEITKVTAFYMAVPKGKRKEIRQSYSLATLDGHCELTPEQFVAYERAFWQYTEKEHKSPVRTARICVNHGKTDGDMVFVAIQPRQTQLVMR